MQARRKAGGRNRLQRRLRLASVALFLASGTATVGAATIAPPMLDITAHCGGLAKRNASAMSECVVAESEARSELLQHWAKYTDDGVELCIKAGRKVKRMPYSAMAKCLSPQITPATTAGK